MDTGGENEKRDVRRPMNAFLIFCKRHRSIVREKNPDLDNRSVTRILGDLWANLKDHEKVKYTDLAKQYKDAFMKANPDYKWHNPEKAATSQKVAMPKPTNVKVIRNDLEMMSEGSIIPGKLADPSNMGGLSLLLIAGQQSETSQTSTSQDLPEITEPVKEEPNYGTPVVNKVKWNEESVTKAIVREPGYSPPKTNTETQSPTKQEVERLVLSNSEMNRLVNNEKQKPFHFETHIESFSERKRSASFSETVTSTLKVEDNAMDSINRDLVTRPSVAVKSQNEVKIASETDGKIGIARAESVTRPPMPAWNTESIIKDKEPSHKSLLALAEMCEGKTVSSSLATDNASKPLLFQAVAAPKMSSKSLLTEAFRDTCDKGSYSDILKDNSAYAKWAKGDNQMKNTGDKHEHFDSKSEADEKENISKLMIKDVGESAETSDEESPMITCGKLVVNHIIDRIFSSDIAAAARKASVNNAENNESNLGDKGRQVDTNSIGLPSVNSVLKVEKETKCEIQTAPVESEIYDYDEPDGVKEHPDLGKDAQNKPCDTDTAVVHSDKTDHDSDGKMETEQSSVSILPSLHETVQESEDLATKQLSPSDVPSPSSAAGRDDDGECDMEDSEDFQPVRKSRRRNRGQRYQELINEGIIQPSKERMAALKHDTPKEECSEEDFQSIDSYILPETAIRRIRKRTTSESAKDKMQHLDDAKRYKTGDFDLEAHIATLPACPVESMGRKRGFVRQRHHSETTHIKKDEHTQIPVFDIKKAVSLPPHVKIPSPEKSMEPVVGSRKRKARKHSITHLLPAPPALISNGNDLKGSGTVNETTQDDIKMEDKNKSESVSSSDLPDNSETKSCEMDVFSSTGNVDSDKQSSSQACDQTSGSVSPESNVVMCNTAAVSVSSKDDQDMVNHNDSVLCSEKDDSQFVTCKNVKNNSESDERSGVHENKTVPETQSICDMGEHLSSKSIKKLETNETSDDQRSKPLDHFVPDIPGDQSDAVSNGSCRSEVKPVSCDMSASQSGTVLHEVNHRSNFTQRDYRSGGDLTPCSAIEKDKDLNFNTKVQC